MPSFTQRSTQKELLDGEAIPFDAIRQNMRELDFINTYLGGHAITIKGLKDLLKNASSSAPIHVVEIGCGGGDNLQAIKRWAAKNNKALQLTGIDFNPECIAFARSVPANKGIGFICSDYRQSQFDEPPHIIFSSLFCHHFTPAELTAQLLWLKQKAILGFFINDLHRHPAAYYSIKLLTRLFSKSYLVKADAPLSVLRGFSGADWKAAFASAGITHYRCRWVWAFRWLVTCTTHDATNPF